MSLVRGIKLTGIDQSTGTELLEQFESSEGVNRIPVVQKGFHGIMMALTDLKLDVPLPIKNLLEAQAAGRSADVTTWQAAIVKSLDEESVVKGASDLMKQ